MANFCTKCGKQLEDGQLCDCIQGVVGETAGNAEQGVNDVVTPVAAPVDTPAEVPVEIPVEPQVQQPAQQQFQQQQQYQQPASQQYQQPNQQYQQPASQQYQQPNQQYQQYQQPNQQYQQPNQQYQQPNQQQPYQRSKEAEWVYEKKNLVVNEAKHIFSEIVPLLKKPVTHTKTIADRNSMVIGMEFIGIKVVMCIIILLIAMARLNSIFWGALFDGGTQFKIILLTVIFVAGADILEAFLLKVGAGIFGLRTNFNAMITVSGTKALFDTCFIVVGVLFCLINITLGAFILSAGALLSSVIQIGTFRVVAEGDEDKKPYTFAIVKIVVSFVIGILVGLLMSDYIESLLYFF